MSVQLIGQELVELRYKAATPADIDKVLMRIGERFMERVEAPEDSSMRNSVSFLDKELADARKRLEDAEASVAEYRTKNRSRCPTSGPATCSGWPRCATRSPNMR